MRFDLTILGSSSATPAYGRHPTAQVLCVHDQSYLIDCGEGTQMRMLQYKVKRHKLNHIFISHLHGDHFYGIFGLLGSMALMGRNEPLYVFAPVGLRQMFETVLRYSTNEPMPFELHFIDITDSTTPTLIFENDTLTVTTIPLQHGLPTTGFLFCEKQLPLNLREDQMAMYDIHYQDFASIKAGNDHILPNGTRLPNATLTHPPVPPRSYAYCSDTRYTESIIPLIRHADLLYHEATFLAADAARAAQYGHATAAEAATIAAKAAVKRLIIGHFSARYTDLSPFLLEAQATFAATDLAIEGTTFVIERQK